MQLAVLLSGMSIGAAVSAIRFAFVARAANRRLASQIYRIVNVPKREN